jgi:hypothetical protein
MMMRLLLRLDVREVRPFLVFIIFKHVLIIVIFVLLVRPVVIGHGHTLIASGCLAFCRLSV